MSDRANQLSLYWVLLSLPDFQVGHLFPSGGLKDYGIQGQKQMRDSCLKIFINQIILQFIFYQNSNTSKSCFVASDESFVSFSYINEQYRKKRSFLQTGRSAFFLQKYV